MGLLERLYDWLNDHLGRLPQPVVNLAGAWAQHMLDDPRNEGLQVRAYFQLTGALLGAGVVTVAAISHFTDGGELPDLRPSAERGAN